MPPKGLDAYQRNERAGARESGKQAGHCLVVEAGVGLLVLATWATFGGSNPIYWARMGGVTSTSSPAWSSPAQPRCPGVRGVPVQESSAPVVGPQSTNLKNLYHEYTKCALVVNKAQYTLETHVDRRSHYS